MIHSLEIDSVQFEVSEKKVLSNIYLKCQTGKITGVLGKNGVGKSCLLKIIYGVLPCERSVRIDNIVIAESHKSHTLMTFLPQFNFIPKSLTINQVLKNFQLEYFLFENIFPEFQNRKKQKISNLSGEERRLIELYLIVKSKALFSILDEPFTHLDPIQIEKVKHLLVEEKSKKGFLITDHLYKHVLDIYDSLYILENGKTYKTNTICDIEKYGYARL